MGNRKDIGVVFLRCSKALQDAVALKASGGGFVSAQEYLRYLLVRECAAELAQTQLAELAALTGATDPSGQLVVPFATEAAETTPPAPETGGRPDGVSDAGVSVPPIRWSTDPPPLVERAKVAIKELAALESGVSAREAAQGKRRLRERSGGQRPQPRAKGAPAPTSVGGQALASVAKSRKRHAAGQVGTRAAKKATPTPKRHPVAAKRRKTAKKGR
jgi:hypothetical protein